MTLADLGYNQQLEAHQLSDQFKGFDIGRIISEHKERYVLQSDKGVFNAELLGNLRYAATSRNDFPAVGDWVAYSEYDEGKALIHGIYPRFSKLERKSVKGEGEKQIIATNIDMAFIVQAVDRDFNLNRLERYLTICNASNVQACIVLTKIDLVETEYLDQLLEQIDKRINGIQVVALSNLIEGQSELLPFIEAGKTYCLLGSSGVGKSTLLNHLAGDQLMETSAISTSVNKGRHTTTHRELVLLPGGGIIIDNPGMRAVGITESREGVESTFGEIQLLSQKCKFKDCTHDSEKGCAVLQAVEEGDLDPKSYDNYQKMIREQVHFESSIQERRKKDKQFGKMVKGILKRKREEKF